MKTLFLLSILLCSAALADDVPTGQLYPYPMLTPGEANPELTKDVLCSKSFRTGPYRNVPLSEKKRVLAAYRIPWADHALYEFDHLIPLEGGGANGDKNIWPEPWPQAHKKDKLENLIHKCVCSDKWDLAQAQEKIARDWYHLYLDTEEGTACN